MEKDDYLATALHYFEAFSSKNVACLTDFFDSSCVLQDWEIRAVGKENVIKASQKIFDSVETILVTPVRVYQTGNTLIAELLITINSKEEIAVVDIIEFTDTGKIKHIQAYKR